MKFLVNVLRMAKKRITLPKDFELLLKNATLQELIKIFDTCEIEARGSFNKQTTLGYNECPDALAKWLIEQGADIESLDLYKRTPLINRLGTYMGNAKSLIQLGADVNRNDGKETPLHCAVGRHDIENVTLLLDAGAHVHAVVLDDDDDESNPGYTPLEYVLYMCQNIDIDNTLTISKLLLERGAQKTERMKAFVGKIGESFEFYKSNRSSGDSTEWSRNSLDALYQLFDVTPVAPRIIYDGISPICVTEKTWQKQHQELWKLLVPASGPTQTLQGEVVRISGRISRELKDNGGVNWNKEFIKMTESYLEFVQQGEALLVEELTELSEIVKEVKQKNDEHIYRMTELGVQWVLKNPIPIARPAIKYKL